MQRRNTPARKRKGHLSITLSQECGRRGQAKVETTSPFKERNALPSLGKGDGGGGGVI